MLSRMSFRTRISLTMIGLLLLLGITLALIISRSATQALLDECKKRGLSSAMHVAARIGEPLLATDYLRMKDLVDEPIRSGEDVAYVFLLGAHGRPLVHTFTGGFPVDLSRVNEAQSQQSHRIMLINTGEELVYDFAVPVVIGSERLGTVRLGVSHRRIGGEVDRLLWSIFIPTAVSVVIAAVLGTLLSRTMTQRIRLLRQSAEEIVNGSLDIETVSPPRINCWKLRACERTECPSYENPRHRCWYVAGTLCPSCVEGEYARKIETCRTCTVYKTNAGDEIQDLAEYFDLMAITLKKRMEDLEAIQERMVQSQKLESLGQLAAGVAHELNTPLGIVLGYTQLMLKDFSDDSEYFDWLKTQEKHLRICKRIVSDLLRFSRTTETDKKALNLNDILEEVRTVVEHTFGLDKIRLECAPAPDLPLILADQEKLQQVFLNLLNNAHDAIGADGRVSLATEYDPDKQMVVVSVADTGSGVSSELLPRIFDPFFTTKPVGKGTGLGLAVTFGIVKEHGGYIEVESHTAAPDDGSSGGRKQGGTVFRLHFPVYRPTGTNATPEESANDTPC